MSLLTRSAAVVRVRLPHRVTPIIYGVSAALLAVAAQVFFDIKPPPAYGICVACHTRDVVAWLANHLLGTHWELAPVSLVVPLLTVFGMFGGASLAARRNQEQRPVALGGHWRSLLYGIVVVNAAIIALGCPTRLLLLSAYGDVLAPLAVAGLVAGILLGTFLLARGIIS